MLNVRNSSDQQASLLSVYSANMGDAVRRHRSNVALKAAAVRSQLAHRARTEFVANMNHELRTPLNAIIGFAGMLRQAEELGLTVDKRDEYCTFVLDSANRLLDLLSRVLDFAALESGRFQPEAQPIDLNALVAETVEKIHPRAKVELEATRAHVLADPSAVVKVIDHLLRNAEKFAGANAAIVIRVTASESGPLWVSVEDDGVGMTPAELAIALDPFSQVSSGLDRMHDGMGLGLTLSRMYVESMGGRLVVRSAKGRGTQAAFSLPVTTEKPKPTDVVASLAASSTAPDLPPEAEARFAEPEPAVEPPVTLSDEPGDYSDEDEFKPGDDFDAAGDDILKALADDATPAAALPDDDGIDFGDEPNFDDEIADDAEPDFNPVEDRGRSRASAPVASLTANELQRNTAPELPPFTDPEPADPDKLFTSGEVFDPAALFEDDDEILDFLDDVKGE